MGRDRLQLPFVAALLAIGAFAWVNADFFGHEVIAEMAILAIFVMSLDLLVGYVGLVSLGHAAFLAVGAYATAGLTVFWGWSAWQAVPASMLAAAVFALVIGAFVVRLGGVFFLMITLAIGQMTYAYFFKAREFGADDGMSGTPRVDLSGFGLDVDDSRIFAALTLLFALAVYALLRVVVRSPYGAMLGAINANENRVRALGCNVGLHKLSAFVVAGTLAGLAGSLTAQHSGFVSPDLAFWTVSGEALIMVIVGGAGSLAGAALGAVIVVYLRHELAGFIEHAYDWLNEILAASVGRSLPEDGGAQLGEHWVAFLGLFFLVVVLVAGDGLYGRIESLLGKLSRGDSKRAGTGP
ncbi:MAG: branched-chain amino acid ABC transporter permease [Gammaproteobacteria bacterium]